MKNVLLLDTSVGSLNQGDEIINISIKKNWSELFEKLLTRPQDSKMPGGKEGKNGMDYTAQ